jgi:hypothetical protein
MGMDIDNTETVFVGHGHSAIWRELKDFLHDRLGLKVDEFNRISTAGISTTSRLDEMLDNAAFAFLIMTAEDEQADGKRYARLNVVHEAGLFQGRLGFQKAIILLEEGCEEFSNIHGLGQIRFPKGTISAKFEEIRTVLERETGRPSQHARASDIKVVEVTIPSQDPTLKLTYPLKCYVELRNDSTECADVRVSEYKQQTVTLKKFTPDVLQVKLREWYPQRDGIDRVAVLPGQLFRAWVGVDEAKFNENQIRGLRGKIGTLVFSVNGKPVNVPL